MVESHNAKVHGQKINTGMHTSLSIQLYGSPRGKH